jgi:hypothetical protein
MRTSPAARSVPLSAPGLPRLLRLLDPAKPVVVRRADRWPDGELRACPEGPDGWLG